MSKDKNLKKMYRYVFFETMLFERVIWMLYLKSLGWTVSQISITQAILNISQVVFEIPSGVISDKLSPKRSLILGHFFIVIYLISYFFATIHIFVYLGFFVYGIGLAMISGSDQTLVYQLSRNKEYGKNIGKYNAISLISMAFSTFLSGLISDISWKAVFILSIFAQITCLLIILNISGNTTEKTDDLPIVLLLKNARDIFLETKGLLFLVISIITFQSIMSILDQYTSVFFSFFNTSNFLITSLFTIGLLGASFFSHNLFRLIKTYKEKRLIIFCLFATSILFMLYGINIFLFVAFSFVANQWLYEIIDTSLNIKLHDIIPDSARTTILSIINSLTSLFMAIESLIIGLLTNYVSIKSVFISLGVLSTVITLLAYYRSTTSKIE